MQNTTINKMDYLEIFNEGNALKTTAREYAIRMSDEMKLN